MSSTPPPPPPLANSFVIGTAVISNKYTQTARARAKAEGREEARRSNTKGVPSSVIEKRVAERAKIEDILRNVVAYHIAPRYIWCPPQVRD
jgi:hypothetical protein